MQNRIESRKRVEGHKSQLELERAYRAYTTGQFEKSLKVAEAARQRDPGNPAAYMLMARTCLELGRLETCDRLLGEALKIQEDIPDAHYLRGVVYQRWSRDEQALDAYMTAWNLDPSNVESVHYLLAAGEMLVDMGKYRQARELLLPKLPYFENSAAMHHLLGTIGVLMDDHLVAIHHLGQASLIGGTDEIVTADLARAQLSADRHRDCLRSLEKLQSTLGEDTPTWVFRLRARCYHEMGSPRDARAAYAQLLRVDPDDVGAWIEYGATVHEIGDMKRLQTCADRLLSLAPGRCEGYLYKGMVAFDRGLLDAAEVWFSRAAENAGSEQSIPSLALAHVERLQGDDQSASRRCQQVLHVDPDDPHARHLADLLATGSIGIIPD
jgi:tetratricopeptide (TPR) repeat protein